MNDSPGAEPTVSPKGIRVYSPDSRFDVGLFAALRALARELAAHRSHIRLMFSAEFRAAYAGTSLGVFWNIALPLAPIGVYVLLANLRVFPVIDGIGPALFIGFNVMLWYLFTGFIQRPIAIVKSRNAEAMKTAMPLSARIASSFAQICFEAAVRFVLIIVLIVVYRNWPALSAPLSLFVLLAGVIFCTGAGLVLAVWNAVYTDIERIVTIILQYGIFLSGVIFPLSGIRPLTFLESANPLAVFVKAARELAFTGSLSHGIALAAWTAFGLLLFVVGARFFYVMEHRLRGLA